MTERLEESLGRVLSYMVSETLKARNCEKIDRAEKLSMARAQFDRIEKMMDEMRVNPSGHTFTASPSP